MNGRLLVLPAALLAGALFASTASATPGIEAIRLESSRRAADGVEIGQVVYDGVRQRAVSHTVRPPRDPSVRVSVIAIEMPWQTLDAASWLLAGSPARDIELETAVLIASSKPVEVSGEDLPEAARELYTSVFGARGFELDLAGGLNLIARGRPRDGSPLATTLALVGLKPKDLVLQGSLAADFDLAGLKKARTEERLGKELRDQVTKALSLRAYLPRFSLRGLPASFETGQVVLSVSGEPSVGLGFVLRLPDAEEERSVSCTVTFSKSEIGPESEAKPDTGAGTTGVMVVGEANGIWRRAFGLKGFDLTDVVIQLGFDPVQAVTFGLGGSIRLGSKQLVVAGQLKVHPVTGAPVGGLFAGSLDELGSSDLAAFCDTLAAASPDRSRPAETDLPDFELRGLHIKVAPFEGDADLGVHQGFALKGALHLFGRQVAFVDGAIETSGILPSVRLLGRSDDFDLGAIALEDAEVDVLFGLVKNPHFRLKGAAKLLAGSKRVEVELSRKRLWFDTTDRVAGVFNAHLHVSSPSSEKPTWNLEASAENELQRFLEEHVSKDLVAWAEKAETDFRKASRDLESAKTEVRRLDGEIARERREAQGRVNEHIAKVRKAQRDIDVIDGKIAERRREVNAKRAESKRKLDAAKRKLDRLHAKWRAAVRKREEAKGAAVIAARAAEAKAFTAYKAAVGVHKTASAAYKVLTKVPVDADAQIVALKASKRGAEEVLEKYEHIVRGLNAKTDVLVDLDPQVVKLVAARGVALGALNTAKAVVDTTGKLVTGAGRVAAWAAKHNGDILRIDRVGFASQLAGYLAGNRLEFAIDVRFLGKDQDIRLRANAAQIAKGDLRRLLFDLLRDKA